MKANLVRRCASSLLAVSLAAGIAGCGKSPSGVPFIEFNRLIAGNYFSTALLGEGSLDDALIRSGAEIRISLGTRGTFTGRVFLPGTSGGAQVDVRLLGTWTLVNDDVFMVLDPAVAGLPQNFVLSPTVLDNRVDLRGVWDIAGSIIAAVLTKPLPPADEGGATNFPPF